MFCEPLKIVIKPCLRDAFRGSEICPCFYFLKRLEYPGAFHLLFPWLHDPLHRALCMKGLCICRLPIWLPSTLKIFRSLSPASTHWTTCSPSPNQPCVRPATGAFGRDASRPFGRLDEKDGTVCVYLLTSACQYSRDSGLTFPYLLVL